MAFSYVYECIFTHKKRFSLKNRLFRCKLNNMEVRIIGSFMLKKITTLSRKDTLVFSNNVLICANFVGLHN